MLTKILFLKKITRLLHTLVAQKIFISAPYIPLHYLRSITVFVRSKSIPAMKKDYFFTKSQNLHFKAPRSSELLKVPSIP
jgi:hypothetical protein